LQRRIQCTALNDVEATGGSDVGYALLRLFHWWLIASMICWCTFTRSYWLFRPWLMATSVYWIAIAVFFIWSHYLPLHSATLLRSLSGWFKTSIFFYCCTFVIGLGFGWFKWWVIASVVYWIALFAFVRLRDQHTHPPYAE